jgi:hypothetical protein
MTLCEARLRQAAAQLPPERAPEVGLELVDVIAGLLYELPASYSKSTIEYLLMYVYRVIPTDDGSAAGSTEPPRLRLVVDNDREVQS